MEEFEHQIFSYLLVKFFCWDGHEKITLLLLSQENWASEESLRASSLKLPPDTPSIEQASGLNPRVGIKVRCPSYHPWMTLRRHFQLYFLPSRKMSPVRFEPRTFRWQSLAHNHMASTHFVECMLIFSWTYVEFRIFKFWLMLIAKI